MTEPSKLQSILPVTCLPVPGEKLGIILMYVMPPVVYVLRSTDHATNCEIQ